MAFLLAFGSAPGLVAAVSIASVFMFCSVGGGFCDHMNPSGYRESKVILEVAGGAAMIRRKLGQNGGIVNAF